MAGIKKTLSFSVMIFVLLSNIAFAQSTSMDDSASAGSDNQNFEGRFSASFDSGVSSNEMSRGSLNNEPSEDEMRAMAKAKLGDKFTEEEFQRMMKNYRGGSDNKDNDFSYNQQGFEHTYDAGPSYEGYSKENMIFGMLFEHIGDDIDPREIKQFCNDPDKIADMVISKLKSKVGDIQSLCAKMEERESNCNDESKKMCSMIGTAVKTITSNEMENANSAAFSCPVNKDSIIHACLLRSNSYMGQQMKNMEASCEERARIDADRINRECDNFNNNHVCNRDKFVSQCLNNLGARKDDFDESGKRKVVCPEYTTPSCGENSKLEARTDANGCQSYHCTESAAQCPQQATPACRDGETVQKKSDDRGCTYYYCQVASAQCPEPTQPTCASNSHVEKKVDDRGCISYYCTSNPCPSVTKPNCATEETIQASYDSSGCITGYQCIKQQPDCPEPAKPTCSDGQSLTTRYDSNKCVSYECISVTTNSSGITGSVVFNTYDDYVKQCESDWPQQEKMCQSMQVNCDRIKVFAEKCKEQAKKNNDEFKIKVEENCKSQTTSQILAAEDRCSKIDEERSKCAEQTEKRCGQMKGLAEKCKSTLTEEGVRHFIIEEANKRCKFSDTLEDTGSIQKSEKVEIVLAVINTATQSDFDKLNLFVNDLKEDLKLQDTTVYKGTANPKNFGDIKLLPFVVNAKLNTVSSSEKSKEVKEKLVASRKVEDSANKLASLRDSDVPSQYLYIIEDKANDVLNVSDKLGEIEKKEDEKSVGYKMKRFLGLARQAEQDEIKQLQESKSKLQNSIETLTNLVDEVPSDVAKSILKEQVENLKKQQDDLQVLIDSKEKKAKGFFGIFG